MLYLQELEFEFEIDIDLISFSHAIESVNSFKWINAMRV